MFEGRSRLLRGRLYSTGSSVVVGPDGDGRVGM